MIFYTGVGSRRTPNHICDGMTTVAEALHKRGYTLRSGHATGADRAFELGAKGNAHVYLPWNDFGQKPYRDDPGMAVLGEARIPPLSETHRELIIKASREMGSDFRTIAPSVAKLLYRNVFQVIGMPGEPLSEFVIYWTPGGNMIGGTKYALKVAKLKGVETVFFESVEQVLDELQKECLFF